MLLANLSEEMFFQGHFRSQLENAYVMCRKVELKLIKMIGCLLEIKYLFLLSREINK